MKRTILFFAWVFITLHGFTQHRFQTSYSYAGINGSGSVMSDVIPDWSGGFFALSEFWGSADVGGGIVRINPEGTIWYSWYISDNNFMPAKLCIAPSKSLYIAGVANSSGGYLVPAFVRTDSVGLVQWAKTFEPNPFQGQYSCRGLISTSDGGAIGVFSRSLNNIPSGANQYTEIIKVNSSGNIVWNRVMEHADINNTPVSIVDVGSNLYMLQMEGNNTISGTNLSAFAMINSSGSLIGQAMIEFDVSNLTGMNPYTYLSSAIRKNNGNLAIGGVIFDGISTRGIIIQTDAGFNLLNTNLYEGSNGRAAEVRYLRYGEDSTLVYAGSTFSAGFGGNDLVFVQLNASLDPTHAMIYGTYADEDPVKFGNAESGYYIGASNRDSFDPELNQSYLLKMDGLGNSGCLEATFSVNRSVSNIDLQPGVFTLNPATRVPQNFSPIASVITLIEENHCSEMFCNLELTAVITHAPCFNQTGAINLTINNGQPPYTIEWNGPSGYLSNDEDIFSLLAGGYYATVTDGNGCDETVLFTVNQPAALVSSGIVNGPSCFGGNNGSINLSVSGGTAPYTYLWNGPSGFSSSLEDINGLTEGTYNVMINDANGCSRPDSYVLVAPSSLNVGVSGTNPTCFGASDGQVSATGFGGTPPYTFDWGGGLTSQVISGLPSGPYNVVLTDNNGCTANGSTSLFDPSQISLIISTTAPTCQNSDGSATVDITGGAAPYGILWSTGGTGSSEGGLSQGSYDVEVTDDNGCVASTSFNLGNTVILVELCVITVDTASAKNVIIWEKPVANNIAGFNIYRLTGANYQLVDFWSYDSLSQYVDETPGINPNVTSYRYKISVVDSCGNESILSNYHETIHLTVNQGMGGVMNLIWDNYEGLGSFTYYKIGRFVAGSPTWNVIDSVTSISTTYSDINAPLGMSVQYRVQIVLDDPCVATRAVNHNTTRSNRTQNITVNNIQEQTASNFLVYPNPGNDILNVSLNGTAERLQIKVFDAVGSLIFSEEHKAFNQSTIQTEDWASGVYMLRIESGSKTQTFRWVKL